MLYREIPRTGQKLSALGLGTMRFKGRENAVRTIRRCLELGVNFIESASGYNWESPEENADAWVGEAIKGWDREKLIISSKMQANVGDENRDKGLPVSTYDGAWQAIENSLTRIGTDYLDFYLLWSLGSDEMYEAANAGPLQAMRDAKEQGLVKHLGFTSHAPNDKIIGWLQQNPDMDFIIVYYNFFSRQLDEQGTYGPFEKAIAWAHQRGIGVATMGSLYGGILTGRSPAFAGILPDTPDATLQEMAFRFLLSNPGITSCLSGLNEIAHIEEDVEIVSKLGPMSADEGLAFAQAITDMTGGQAMCTACRYCRGCPEGLRIPWLMQFYQQHDIFQLPSVKEKIATMTLDDAYNPDRCVECGQCEEKCPQDLPIIERIHRVQELAAQYRPPQ